MRCLAMTSTGGQCKVVRAEGTNFCTLHFKVQPYGCVVGSGASAAIPVVVKKRAYTDKQLAKLAMLRESKQAQAGQSFDCKADDILAEAWMTLMMPVLSKPDLHPLVKSILEARIANAVLTSEEYSMRALKKSFMAFEETERLLNNELVTRVMARVAAERMMWSEKERANLFSFQTLSGLHEISALETFDSLSKKVRSLGGKVGQAKLKGDTDKETSLRMELDAANSKLKALQLVSSATGESQAPNAPKKAKRVPRVIKARDSDPEQVEALNMLRAHMESVVGAVGVWVSGVKRQCKEAMLPLVKHYKDMIILGCVSVSIAMLPIVDGWYVGVCALSTTLKVCVRTKASTWSFIIWMNVMRGMMWSRSASGGLAWMVTMVRCIHQC